MIVLARILHGVNLAYLEKVRALFSFTILVRSLHLAPGTGRTLLSYMFEGEFMTAM